MSVILNIEATDATTWNRWKKIVTQVVDVYFDGMHYNRGVKYTLKSERDGEILFDTLRLVLHGEPIKIRLDMS